MARRCQFEELKGALEVASGGLVRHILFHCDPVDYVGIPVHATP